MFTCLLFASWIKLVNSSLSWSWLDKLSTLVLETTLEILITIGNLPKECWTLWKFGPSCLILLQGDWGKLKFSLDFIIELFPIILSLFSMWSGRVQNIAGSGTQLLWSGIYPIRPWRCFRTMYVCMNIYNSHPFFQFLSVWCS